MPKLSVWERKHGGKAVLRGGAGESSGRLPSPAARHRGHQRGQIPVRRASLRPLETLLRRRPQPTRRRVVFVEFFSLATNKLAVPPWNFKLGHYQKMLGNAERIIILKNKA